MKPSRLLLPALLATVVLAAGLGCDKASPVAPTGTTLSISASPSRIAVTGEASTIRVTALRANGTPVNPGTQVRLVTTLGTVSDIAETDSSGVARAELRGDGRIGTATVSARTGSTEAVTVDVEIGQFAANLTLQASPSQVSGLGGSVALLAIVRDDQARPMAGTLVNFRTDVGTLDSRGALRPTNANGEVRDTLRVTEDDARAFNSPQFTVSALALGEGGSEVSDSTQVRILAVKPTIEFFARADGGNQVFFDNLTQGQAPISYQWDFQNDGTVDSTSESPTFNYGNPGTFTVRLDASNSAGEDTARCTITVPITTAVRCTSD